MTGWGVVKEGSAVGAVRMGVLRGVLQRAGDMVGDGRNPDNCSGAGRRVHGHRVVRVERVSATSITPGACGRVHGTMIRHHRHAPVANSMPWPLSSPARR